MPMFPSKEWCEEVVRLMNADPESAMAVRGWVGDLGAVVEAEPGRLARTFVVHVEPASDGIRAFRVLEEPEDLEELEPAYLARAAYSVWKELLRGTLDPVEAVLLRRLELKGDLQPLIERLRYKGIAERILERLRSNFVDEQ